MQSPLNGNAYGLSEGKRLFSWFNCVGCHHHGGGGIGPALMDHRWVYGSRPDQIYSTIVQGRPNGMPSYAGRLTDQQVWQLVAYVESLAGNAAKDAAPGREDDMSSSKPEMRREPRPPVQTGHR
jgi:cytochrome c oxidase cbb3-type subunit 3